MADTGFKIPTAQDLTGTTWGTISWSTAGSGLLADTPTVFTNEISITLSSATKSKDAYGKTFGFAVPTGATIDGIEVVVSARNFAAANEGRLSNIRLKNEAGAFEGDDKGDNWLPTNYDNHADRTYGGAADLWGGTWDEAAIEDADFGPVTAWHWWDAVSGPRVNTYRVKVYYTEAAGGTNVLANTDALTLTEQPATVNAEINVQANADALTLTEFSASVELGGDVEVLAGVVSLSLTELTAAVNAETNVLTSPDALTLTPLAATIELSGDINVAAGVDTLVLAEQPAVVNAETNILTAVDALTLTELTATVNVAITIQASFDTLIIAEQPAAITFDTNVLASTDALIIATFDASVSLGGIPIALPTAKLRAFVLPESRTARVAGVV